MAASNGGSFPACLPILDAKNYSKWCIQMRVLLDYQEVLEIVMGGVQLLAKNATDP